MNETEIKDRPVNDEVIELDPEDFNEELDNSSEEETSQPNQDEVSTPAETEDKEVDFTPLLEKLSKEIKYMDNEVKIESLEDVKTNYQKGLNYGKLEQKLQSLENDEGRLYLTEKAKEAGLSIPDYIKAIKDYEVQQTKLQEEQELNEMIENGVAETIARKVIETNRIAKELAEEKFKLKEQQEEQNIKAKKEAENDQFLSAYPDVKISDIPKEVFLEAEKVGLLTAYTKYSNEQLKKELELLKQNQSNKEKSPIKATTEHGGVVIEKEDPFLMGFNS